VATGESGHHFFNVPGGVLSSGEPAIAKETVFFFFSGKQRSGSSRVMCRGARRLDLLLCDFYTVHVTKEKSPCPCVLNKILKSRYASSWWFSPWPSLTLFVPRPKKNQKQPVLRAVGAPKH